MVKMMKIGLNITEQKANYKAKYTEDLERPLCNEEEDVTEHVLNYGKVPELKTYGKRRTLPSGTR